MATRLKKAYVTDTSEHEKIETLLEEILENLDDGLEDLHFTIEELEEKVDAILDHIENCEEHESGSHSSRRKTLRR